MSRARPSSTQEITDELNDLIYTPVVGNGSASHLAPLVDLSTIDQHQMSPVVISSSAVMRQMATVDNLTTVDNPHTSTGDKSIWISESGELIAASRVNPIVRAQDMLTSTESDVYSVLWQAANANAQNLVQMGYQELGAKVRMKSAKSRKTIQRIIDKLIDKGFIGIATPPDIYRRTATVYRVYDFTAALESQRKRGRSHVANIGPGRVFVHLSTVDNRYLSTVVNTHPTTGPNLDLSTVAKMTTSLEKKRILEQTTTAKVLLDAFEAEGISVRNGGIESLVQDCRDRVPDVTPDELLALFHGHLPASKSRSIFNPAGFLLRAIRDACTPEAIGEMRQSREAIPIPEPEQYSREELEHMATAPGYPGPIRAIAIERLKSMHSP